MFAGLTSGIWVQGFRAWGEKKKVPSTSTTCKSLKIRAKGLRHYTLHSKPGRGATAVLQPARVPAAYVVGVGEEGLEGCRVWGRDIEACRTCNPKLIALEF